MNEITCEWVRLTPEAVVVATGERAWLHRPAAEDTPDHFVRPMQGRGSLATTRRLLEGALAAGQRTVAQVERQPPLSPARWVWRLAGYYHTTHATPRLMAEAARRFDAAGRHELAAYARLKVEDEGGHDELALKDLRALGYPAEAVVAALVPPTAARLVDFFTRTVESADPIGCVGYAYALERMAIATGLEYIRRVEAVLPAGVRATRCLRVHSAVGADVSHVEDAVAVTAGLSAAERTQIALACYETAKLCCAPVPGGPLSDEELEHRLAVLIASPAS